MRTFMAVLVLVAMVVWMGPAEADYPGSTAGIVKLNHLKVSNVVVTSTAKAAGSASTNTDAMSIGRSEAHSIACSVTTTQNVTLSIPVQVSYDGTNWSTEQTVSLSFTSAAPVDFAALNLPVAPHVRAQLASHATYPVTYTAAVICAW